jgi:hypothetical protein
VKPDSPATYTTFVDEIFVNPYARMRAVKMPFMDALILNLAERTPGVNTFITWNAKHFQNKSKLSVMTPAAYLEQSV